MYQEVSRDLRSQYRLDYYSSKTERDGAWRKIDLRVRRHFRFDGWEMTAFAEGLNLTNHENVLWYAWRLTRRESAQAPERIARTGIPGIPSVGVEVRF